MRQRCRDVDFPILPLSPPATVESRSLAKFLAICGVEKIEKGEIRWRNWMVYHILSSPSLWNEIFMARKSRILVFFISIIIIFPYSFHHSMAIKIMPWRHCQRSKEVIQWSADPATIHPLEIFKMYIIRLQYYLCNIIFM